MSGNTFGRLFKITTFGESHGTAIGCIIDGCPSLLEISESDIQNELDRRRPGQSSISTPRDEVDKVEILSGIFEGKTTGTPICLIVKNKDQKSNDYDKLKDTFRPGHADFTYQMKYGIRDHRGGGRSSARETIARVAAGAIAKKYLKKIIGLDIIGYTESIGNIKCDNKNIDFSIIEKNAARCPNSEIAKEMIQFVEKMKENGDSAGGVVRCIIKNCPIGLGEPVFDKLSALLAHAIMSINAVKAFEIGEGLDSVNILGSENNDEFFNHNGIVSTKTNHCGGILGGISNGQEIDFRVYFKPVSTIKKEQNTINANFENTKIKAEGRHDPCVVPRAIPIVESMAAIVLMDLFLINHGIYGRFE